MEKKATLLLMVMILSHTLAYAQAFNITKILSEYPDYSVFNQLLSDTKVANEINKRKTITVLVVNNGAVSAIIGKPMQVVKNVLSAQVLLDFFDVETLEESRKGYFVTTTLFQATGLAEGQDGYMNITRLPQKKIVFGTPGTNTPQDWKPSMQKEVKSSPYDISVLEINSLVQPSSALVSSPPSQTTPPPPPSPASIPSSSPPSPSPKDDNPSSPPKVAKPPPGGIKPSPSPKNDKPSPPPPPPPPPPPSDETPAPDAEAPTQADENVTPNDNSGSPSTHLSASLAFAFALSLVTLSLFI